MLRRPECSWLAFGSVRDGVLDVVTDLILKPVANLVQDLPLDMHDSATGLFSDLSRDLVPVQVSNRHLDRFLDLAEYQAVQ